MLIWHFDLSLYSFLVARNAGGPVGFLNFRFDLDENIEVIYW